jgi:hypothetical protein
MTVVVLEHPRIRSEKRFNDIANTPLWSCLMGGYAAAAIAEAGLHVCLLDTTVRGWDFDRTEREILRIRPTMLAVNAVYFWERTPRLFLFFSRLREAGFGGHINLFGFFPTLAYRAILVDAEEVDSIAVGECENTLAELAGALSRGRDWRNVPGLAYRSQANIRITAPRMPEANPDRFPFPLRELESGGTSSILASRGCYNHCSFCPVPSFYGKGPLWRGRSPNNILDEVTQLLDRGARDFYFVDPNFIGPGKKGRQRTRRIAESLRPLKISFGMETRSSDLDEDILDGLVASGLDSLLLGIESGSPSVLGRLGKSASLSAAERAIALCRSVGIEPEVGFLMFVPDSTVEDLERNLEFLKSNQLLDRLDRTANVLSHSQIILMGTADYARFKEEGRLTATSPFGFEGEVPFMDERVRWMCELVGHACLFTLREMSQPESPVFWRKVGDGAVCSGVNDFLVDFFERSLREAYATVSLPPVADLKRDVEKQLLERIADVRSESADGTACGGSRQRRRGVSLS